MFHGLNSEEHFDVDAHLKLVVHLNQLLQFRGVFFRLDEAGAETPGSRLSGFHTAGLSD